MDEKVLAYRKKHKRCRYCKYYKKGQTFSGYYRSCVLKNKYLSNGNLTGCFCKWYELKEE